MNPTTLFLRFVHRTGKLVFLEPPLHSTTISLSTFLEPTEGYSLELHMAL